MTAGDGDVRAGKISFRLTPRLKHCAHHASAVLGISRRTDRLGHDQDVTAVAAHQATVFHMRAAEAGLQRQHFRHHQRAHADGIGRDDILQNHSFRPGEFTPHHGEKFADGIRLNLFRKSLFVLRREQVRQRAGQQTDDLPLIAQLDAIGDVPERAVRGETRVKIISRAADGFGIGVREADVDEGTVNLPEFIERVFVFADDAIALRQKTENVLLHAESRRDDRAGHGQQK